MRLIDARLLVLVLLIAGCAAPPPHVERLTSYSVRGNATIALAFNVSGFTQQARSAFSFAGRVDGNASSIDLRDDKSVRHFNESYDAYGMLALLVTNSTALNKTAGEYVVSLPADAQTTHRLLHAFDQPGTLSAVFALPETIQSSSIVAHISTGTRLITHAEVGVTYVAATKGGVVTEHDAMSIAFSP